MIQGSNMHVQGPQIHQFNNIAPMAIPRSSFQRDFTRRTTFDPDYLVPIFLDEILPGDEINLRMTSFTRMSTPIKPLMDNLYLETFWFFVPNRLVWDNWEKFQGQQNTAGASVDYTIPVLNNAVAPMSTTGFITESIYDYFGLPTLVTSLDNISCLFNRAYNLVVNQWFFDENLDTALPIFTGDGPDDPGQYFLAKRRSRKDYFTSCLPWPQKGDAPGIPLSGIVPIVSSGATMTWNVAGATNTTLSAQGGPDRLTPSLGVPTPGVAATWGDETGLEGDLSGVTDLITINALRQTALYQQVLELDARGGTRYVESIYNRFGVISPDFRLQRPELIGQASTRINVYAVPQTAPTVEGQTPQGNLAAFGTAVTTDHGCRYAATEHGMIIGLANVRADLTYQQGVPKMFTRQTRLDFYEPLLNGLGEQVVLLGELYAQGTADDQDVFGYQERFSEYRFKNSEITGKFRSNAPGTLDIWHLSKQYGPTPPFLGTDFIAENVPIDRVLAVTTEPAFLSDMHFSYNHVRPMPIRSNPGIDRL